MYDWRKLYKICLHFGCEEMSRKGSHLTMLVPGSNNPLTIMMKRNLKMYLVDQAAKRLNIDKQEFRKMVRKGKVKN